MTFSAICATLDGLLEQAHECYRNGLYGEADEVIKEYFSECKRYRFAASRSASTLQGKIKRAMKRC